MIATLDMRAAERAAFEERRRWRQEKEGTAARTPNGVACPAVADTWPAPLDPAAFHGLAGNVMRAIEPHSEADPVALLVQLLAAFGNAIGRGPCFEVEGSDHPAGLFVLLAGLTAKGRKGTSWGHIERLMAMADPDWARERIVSGLSSGEGLIWAVRDPIEKQERIKEKGEAVRYQTTVVYGFR